MKLSSKLILFSMVFIGALAVNGSIKQRLSQTNSQSMVEGGDCACGSSGTCTCGIFPSCTLPELFEPECDLGPQGAPPPASGGAGDASVYNSALLAVSGQTTNQIPDTGSVTNCDGNCKACNSQNE